jgi:hypothetical protein
LVLREGGLELVHALGAAFVDDALGTVDQDVVALHAEMADQSRDTREAAPAPEMTTLHVGNLRPVISQALISAGRGDDGGAVLVVVEDGDVERAQLAPR